MTEWMSCNTCRRVVWQNETGICLACQGGFSGKLAPDDYFLQNPMKEEDYAIEEGIEQEDDWPKHKDGDSTWEVERPSRSNRPPNCS